MNCKNMMLISLAILILSVSGVNAIDADNIDIQSVNAGAIGHSDDVIVINNENDALNDFQSQVNSLSQGDQLNLVSYYTVSVDDDDGVYLSDNVTVEIHNFSDNAFELNRESKVDNGLNSNDDKSNGEATNSQSAPNSGNDNLEWIYVIFNNYSSDEVTVMINASESNASSVSDQSDNSSSQLKSVEKQSNDSYYNLIGIILLVLIVAVAGGLIWNNRR